jgi:hypothetical protein
LSKNLRVNQFYSEFVVRHIERFVPQLERLLVRSEANIEVWEEFVLAVQNWQGIDSQVLEMLKKIKGQFLSQPEPCIRIVVSLTSHLKDEKTLKEVVEFLGGLVGGEHNAKRKIVYIRMLKGTVSSLQRQSNDKLRNILTQELLLVIANSLIKFTEEEEFGFLVPLVDSLVAMVDDPKDDIAKSLKLYLKNQNKFILVLFGLILCNVYKGEHVNTLPSVKEIYNHFKSQLATITKKAEANWQWLMPVLYFLAGSDLEVMDHLGENIPIFKGSCIALTAPEMKVALKLIVKKIEFLKKEEEEVEDYVYASAALLLEEVNSEPVWRTFLTQLEPQEKIMLVTRGVFPLKLFGCEDLKKNKGNNFGSLLLFLEKEFRKQTIEVESAEDFAKLVVCF